MHAKRQNLDADAVQLMQVYAAWLAALDANAAEQGACAFSGEGADAAATAEAADVLAQLYLARGDRAAAKKAVDFGLGFRSLGTGPRFGRERLFREKAMAAGGTYPPCRTRGAVPRERPCTLQARRKLSILGRTIHLKAPRSLHDPSDCPARGAR